MAIEASKLNLPVVVSTGDKDIAQLVDEHITLVNTMTDTTLDRDGVYEKFGIAPDLIIDYLALLGDKSDNIPGVPGVGEKTALALLQGIGGLDSIYNRLDEVAELPFRGAKTTSAKLVENKELAYLSYELATIKTDVKLPLGVTELQNASPDQDQLLTLFTEMEFKTWVTDLSSTGVTEHVIEDIDSSQLSEPEAISEKICIQKNYQMIVTEEQLDIWLEKLKGADLLAVDTETTSLDYMEAELVGISFAIAAGQAAYIPFGHDYLGAPKQLAKDLVMKRLKPILENPSLKKVGQNLKYDMSV